MQLLLTLTIAALLPRFGSGSLPAHPFADLGLKGGNAFTRLADVAPLAPSDAIAMRWRGARSALRKHWKLTRSGYCDDVTLDAVGKEKTYGEITAIGGRQLAESMGIAHAQRDSIVFADLGSGVGKLAAQVWLENLAVRRSIGVELGAARHARGTEALNALISSGDAAKLRSGGVGIELVHGDVLALPDEVLREATHVYVAALCFPPDLLRRFGEALANATRFPNLEVVGSLSDIPELTPLGGWCAKPQRREMQVSWGRTSCRVYTRTAPAAAFSN